LTVSFIKISFKTNGLMTFSKHIMLGN
jgi:hypothetical protein